MDEATVKINRIVNTTLMALNQILEGESQKEEAPLK